MIMIHYPCMMILYNYMHLSFAIITVIVMLLLLEYIDMTQPQFFSFLLVQLVIRVHTPFLQTNTVYCVKAYFFLAFTLFEAK